MRRVGDPPWTVTRGLLKTFTGGSSSGSMNISTDTRAGASGLATRPDGRAWLRGSSRNLLTDRGLRAGRAGFPVSLIMHVPQSSANLSDLVWRPLEHPAGGKVCGDREDPNQSIAPRQGAAPGPAGGRLPPAVPAVCGAKPCLRTLGHACGAPPAREPVGLRGAGTARRTRGLPVPRADVEDVHEGSVQPRTRPPFIRRRRGEALRLAQGPARAPGRRAVALQNRAGLERRDRRRLRRASARRRFGLCLPRGESRRRNRAERGAKRAGCVALRRGRRGPESLQERGLLGPLRRAEGNLLLRA